MHLCIDIGNSWVKAAVFKGEELLFSDSCRHEVLHPFLDTIIDSWPIERSILSSVSQRDESLIQRLAKHRPLHQLSSQSRLPFPISYESPETLGADRLAAAAGARQHFKSGNLLVISFGSCITFNMLSEQHGFEGGSISPGIQMRHKALHTFTAKLPLLAAAATDQLIGKTTEQSIYSGVYQGAVSEVAGMIEKWQSERGPLHIAACGGELSFFAPQLKYDIFADSMLIMYGLNKILELNVE